MGRFVLRCIYYVNGKRVAAASPCDGCRGAAVPAGNKWHRELTNACLEVSRIPSPCVGGGATGLLPRGRLTSPAGTDTGVGRRDLVNYLGERRAKVPRGGWRGAAPCAAGARPAPTAASPAPGRRAAPPPAQLRRRPSTARRSPGPRPRRLPRALTPSGRARPQLRTQPYGTDESGAALKYLFGFILKKCCKNRYKRSCSVLAVLPPLAYTGVRIVNRCTIAASVRVTRRKDRDYRYKNNLRERTKRRVASVPFGSSRPTPRPRARSAAHRRVGPARPLRSAPLRSAPRGPEVRDARPAGRPRRAATGSRSPPSRAAGRRRRAAA